MKLKVSLLIISAVNIYFCSILWAEPYIAIREGYKCSKCHVNITGGGKRTDFGNIYVQTRLPQYFVQWASPGDQTEPVEEELSSAQKKKKEEQPEEIPPQQNLYNGNVNDFFSIGGDIRAELRYLEEPGQDKTHGFKLSKTLLYYRIDFIPDQAFLYVDQSDVANIRENFAMFRGTEYDAYLKVGRMFLPSGFRLQDDDAYVRAVSGFTYGLSDEGFEVGVEPGPFSFSLAVTNGGTEIDKQTSFYGYMIGEPGMIGFSQSVKKSESSKHVMNIFAGFNAGRLTGLAQVDKIEEDQDGSPKLEKQVGFLELNVMLYKGANLKLTYDFHDPNINEEDDTEARMSIAYEPFLTQFFQIRTGYRNYSGPSENTAANLKLLFTELHLIF
ncbi:MAG: hypothetical protein HQM11_05585 [SAR324 cluster bacterium]|nr:hypothetical protein [SAR324 cluster bacterium]